MAEDQVGLQREAPRQQPLWTKLFTAFMVALDPKKLLLAGAGIVVMALGWWILSQVFYLPWKQPPTWTSYKDPDNEAESWKAFKVARNRWNLLYEMAGPGWRTDKDDKEIGQYDAADVATSAAEYDKIVAEVKAIKDETQLRRSKVEVLQEKTGAPYFQVGNYAISFEPVGEESRAAVVKALADQKLEPTKLAASSVDRTNKTLTVGSTKVKLPDLDQWDKFYRDLLSSKQLSDIEQEIREGRRANPAYPEVPKKALELVQAERKRFKPAGRLSSWPWSEYRGPNPYLLITGRAGISSDDNARAVPWLQGHFFEWLLSDEVPVLLEPLIKFLRPVVYMLHPAAGGWNRVYLILIILWALATWALFGGAITRMAAVQVARNNEKIGLTEAVRFAWSRYQSFFSAPLLPLIFITILTILLWLFGLVVGYTWFIGDIIVAGLGLPLALILGLIIAVVLVGLVGWPLMYATISTEGSDSFDAISRSYSYVYSAPWHYLWYALVALGYGAVLVFFVGLMGSLIAYTTKWGASLAPTLQSREPSYLFTYAPRSFGWRDLLLYQSPNAELEEVVRPDGLVTKEREVRFTSDADPQKNTYPMTWNNWIGAVLVAFWLGLLFLFVVGFGYSYFWTAGTIIYLLMRRKVDDTDLDEIHLEEEAEEPYVPATSAPATTPAAGKPGATPLTMVEPPTLRTPPPEPVPPEPPASEPPRNADLGTPRTDHAPAAPAEPVSDTPPAPPPGPTATPEGGADRGSPG
jgi:hypothetical protein